MACVFEYKGKQYSQDELVGALKNAPLNEIADFVPGINKVPDAPFKKSWPELAMKRAIRTAVEDGKTRVSWTPGEAQAARYDLSKQVESINAWKNPDGTFKVDAYPKDRIGNPTSLGNNIAQDKLSEFVGKDLAEKISGIKTVGGPANVFKGGDLKVGGEGMKGFYDQMLPKMVEKLGKKYGVKVKEGTLPVSPKEFNPEWMKLSPEERAKIGQKVHYFDIPEKMKRDVLTKGFSLFSNPLPIPNQRND
ncbi:MAG: hypothetical protein KGI58_03955 [Patescibacteria group bacterium]|nr:hypothetical protein [Patescibacteria group bacterium]